MAIRFGAMAVLTSAGLPAVGSGAAAQSLEGGRKSFEQRCARCHGGDGWGGEMGPPIAVRLTTLADRELETLIHDGRPLKGMPGSALSGPEMTGLRKFLRAIQREAPPVV